MQGDRHNEEVFMDAAAGVIAGGRAKPLSALADAVVERQVSPAWLLETARGGDGQAFAALIREYQTPIHQFILRMVRRPATADDLAQEVFIRLWRHIGEIESVAMLPGWLRRVAANAVIDHWRKDEARERRMRVLREHPVARYTVKPSSRMETAEALDIVQLALDELPAKLRSVLLLRTQEEMSYEEVADLLGMSVHAVRSRLFRARRELLEILKHKNAADYLERMYRPPQKGEMP
jgi:RNA polymerase sigma-70 factor (ECF subfamily)